MKTWIIFLFLLMPFALNIVLAQPVIHTHEVAVADDHEGNHHLPDWDDNDEHPFGSHAPKTHAHDGQIHDFLRGETLAVAAYETRHAFDRLSSSLLHSASIEPPLEPPTSV